MAPELLELVSLMLIHRFHSEDWYQYLKAKVALPPRVFDTIRELATGQALVFAAAQSVVPSAQYASTPLLLSVRARFTRDLGASVTNSGCPPLLLSVRARFTRDLGASVTNSGCPRTLCARVCDEDQADCPETATSVRRLRAAGASSKTAPRVQAAKTHEDKVQNRDKMQTWLSLIVENLEKAGGHPLALEHVGNPAAGGVARPAGLAKHIKLRTVLAVHAHKHGLVLTDQSVALA